MVSFITGELSNGKFEGVNQKTRASEGRVYGLTDDEYFFLKQFDTSRQRWRSLEDD